jgi:Domain of unknown function (DUF4249)
MKNIISYILLVFSILFFTIACTKTDPLSTVDARAVVEGYLGAGDTVDITITKEIPFGSDSSSIAEPIYNLAVSLEIDGKTIALQPRDSGHYSANYLIEAEKTYKLKFNYNGQTVTASTTIPARPQGFKMSVSTLTITPITFGSGIPGTRPTFPDPVQLTWANNDQTFYLSAFRNVDTIQESILTGSINFGRIRRPIFNRPTQSNVMSIEPQRIQYYGNHIVLLMHVQPEYAALYEDTGSSSLNLSPPPTNISNGLGIFTGFAADTLKLYVKKP